MPPCIYTALYSLQHSFTLLYFLILTKTLQVRSRQALLTLILQGRKKLKEDKQLAQGHSVSM